MSRCLRGIVVDGNRIGRTLDYPTANIVVEDKSLLPDCGVYAARARLAGNLYDAMLYIGSRPTVVDSTEVVVEVNILNFNGTIYGEALEVEVVEFVRGEVTFDSLEDLRRQISADKEIIENILKTK